MHIPGVQACVAFSPGHAMFWPPHVSAKHALMLIKSISISVDEAGAICAKLSVLPLKARHGTSRIIFSHPAVALEVGEMVAFPKGVAKNVMFRKMATLTNVMLPKRTSMLDVRPLESNWFAFCRQLSRNIFAMPALPHAYSSLAIW